MLAVFREAEHLLRWHCICWHCLGGPLWEWPLEPRGDSGGASQGLAPGTRLGQFFDHTLLPRGRRMERLASGSVSHGVLWEEHRKASSVPAIHPTASALIWRHSRCSPCLCPCPLQVSSCPGWLKTLQGSPVLLMTSKPSLTSCSGDLFSLALYVPFPSPHSNCTSLIAILQRNLMFHT